MVSEHAAARRVKGPIQVGSHLQRRQGLEDVLDACERIWPEWADNGCRLLDLGVPLFPPPHSLRICLGSSRTSLD